MDITWIALLPSGSIKKTPEIRRKNQQILPNHLSRSTAASVESKKMAESLAFFFCGELFYRPVHRWFIKRTSRIWRKTLCISDAHQELRAS
jgi:hypothetical protein